MSLVAALTGHEGIVMFSDTQETVAGYSKKTIDKMEVWDFPNRPFRFALAGAADDANYADMLQAELAGALLCVPEFDLRKICDALSLTLTTFYGKHIWPRSTDRPRMEYIIAIQPLPSGVPGLFHIAESAANVIGITTHNKSIGVGSYLADYLFNLILGGGEPLAWLCAAAVHVAREVRDCIDGVGHIDRVVLLDRHGEYDELSPIDIEAVQNNVEGMNEAIRHLFSLAADISEGSEKNGLEESIIGIAQEAREGQLRWMTEFRERTKRRTSYLTFFADKVAAKKSG